MPNKFEIDSIKKVFDINNPILKISKEDAMEIKQECFKKGRRTKQT